MIGTTGIKDLRIDCIVGIYPHEREGTQPIFVDVEVDYDFSAAATSDAIASVLDYDALADGLTKVATEGRFELLEAMVEAMSGFCLDAFNMVNAVRLEVRKPEAVKAAHASFVRVARSRQ